ncbi:MAG TPA: hypothetical protein VFA97_04190 [Gaiellaceae bacterium]|nr:hypothetical protein [Gaiellaceae bacterium]
MQPSGDDAAAQASELETRVERLEHALRAIEQSPDVDRAVIRAATAHTRLVCDSAGYAIDEIDEPPPDTGASVERDGRMYTVWRLSPSPFPGDARRCAVLVPA